MKDWVSKLKMALDNLHRSRHSVPDIPEVHKKSNIHSILKKNVHMNLDIYFENYFHTNTEYIQIVLQTENYYLTSQI